MWVRQSATLVGLYAALMCLLALWMPVWHDLDWRFFQSISATHAPAISPKIALVDVSSWNPEDPPGDRRTVARFLHQIVAAKQHPKAVILDIEFGPCQSDPCRDEIWTSARATLERALGEASRAGLNVYAAEGIQQSHAGNDQALALDPHDPEIYSLLTGAAQTHFTPAPGAAGLFYRVCYEVPRLDQRGAQVGSEAVWAMVWRVMPDFEVSQPCDTEHLPLFIGETLDKYVIVGTVREDRPKDADRSGPELVAWALSDVLEGEGPRATLQAHYQARPQNTMLLLFVPGFSAFTAFAFTAVFFPLRRMQLKGARRFLPWVAALSALVAGLGIFALFELWMLAEKWIQPQVTLISLGILLAAVLCGIRGNQIEFEELYALDDTAPAEKYDYDVFISYAHDEGAWVYEHVYLPLKAANLPNGVFFDTTDIRGGTSWQSKIALAIDASRFIVPVYSETYFQRPYCRFEINRAHRKWVNAGEESRCVLPIMRGHPKILAAVDDIQAISIDDQPDIVERYVAEISARLR